MIADEYKKHACDFAEWKKEYDSIEGFEFRRIVKKLGGSPTVASEPISSIYDKWVNRNKMGFSDAIALTAKEKMVTRPRFWAVHRGYLKMVNGILHVFTEYKPDGIMWKPELSYSDDTFSDDWMELTQDQIKQS